MWNATPTASISGSAMMLAKFNGMPMMRRAISVHRVAITSGPSVIATSQGLRRATDRMTKISTKAVTAACTNAPRIV